MPSGCFNYLYSAAERMYLTFNHDGGGSTDYTIGAAYFGLSAGNVGGNPYDFAEAPTQLLFGGSGSTVVSGLTRTDNFDFAYGYGNAYVLSVYLSSGTNYMHKDNTPNLSTVYEISGNEASLEELTGSPSSTADLWIFLSAVVENDPLELTEDLFFPELDAGTPPSAFCSLPVFECSATAYGGSATLDARLSTLEIEAEVGARWNLEEDLPTLSCSAQMGARADDELFLSSLECSATGVNGALASLSEVLGFPSLVTSLGWRVEETLPVPTLEMEMTGAVTASLDGTMPGLLFSGEAQAFRGGVRENLFNLELEASMLGLTDGLSVTLGFPELSATCRADYITVDADLFRLDLTATMLGIADGLDTILGFPELSATCSSDHISLDADLFRLDLTATMLGLRDGLSATLAFPDLSATGHADYMTVDADLFRLDLTATMQGLTDGLDATLGFPDLSATGRADYITVDATLFRLDLTATMLGLADGMDATLGFPELVATGGRETRLDATLPQMEVTARAGERANLSVNLMHMELSASATSEVNSLDLDLFHLELSATAGSRQASLDQAMPWMSLDATAISGYVAIMDQILSSPTLSATVQETPLMTLDAEIGPPYMTAQSSGDEDQIPDGGVIVDPTRWSTTVLRHSRW